MNEKDQKHIEQVTSYLLNKLDGEELNEFLEWLNNSSENGLILEQTREAWNLASLSNPKTKFSSEDGWHDFTKKRKSANSNLIVSNGLKIAAALVISFTLGALGYYFFNKSFINNPQKAEMFETVVPNGSKTEMYLADGTKVWLNAGTTLRYRASYSKNKRDVFLDGEACFDVKKDPEHPFIVHVCDIEVKAVGTSFNVKAYANEKTIETTLVEGKVLVSKKDGEDPITMSPNQKLTLVNNEKDFAYSIEELKQAKPEKEVKEELLVMKKAKNAILEKEIDIKPEVSWKENEWLISGMSLEELAIQLQRRYDVNISISDNDLRKYRFTGTILDESLEQVLTYLSRVAPIKYEIDGKKVMFSVNKKFVEQYQQMLKTKNN